MFFLSSGLISTEAYLQAKQIIMSELAFISLYSWSYCKSKLVDK